MFTASEFKLLDSRWREMKAGLRNAQAKGRRLGRPPRIVDAARIAALRASGMLWRTMSREMGIGIATLYRCCKSGC